MTAALCLRCGSIKFGAFLPCNGCHGQSTGDQQLDCLFTDHYFTESTLRELGKIVSDLRLASQTEAEYMWAFLYLFAGWYPQGMAITIPADYRDGCASLISQVKPSPFTLQMADGSTLTPTPFNSDPKTSPSSGPQESPAERQLREAEDHCELLASGSPLPKTRRGEAIDTILFIEYAKTLSNLLQAIQAMPAAANLLAASDRAFQWLTLMIERANAGRPSSQPILNLLLEAHSALSEYDVFHHDASKSALPMTVQLLKSIRQQN